jgi:hypothetical protein
VEQLSRAGIAWLEGIETPEALLREITAIGHIRAHPHANAEGMTLIELASREQASLEASATGFTAEGLPPHTDRSTDLDPPALVALALLKGSLDGGGEAVLVDGRRVCRMLAAEAPETIDVLTRHDAARFGPPPGTPFPIFEPRGGRIVMRYRDDGLMSVADYAQSSVDLLTARIEACAIRRPLHQFEGYILNNGWWLHGRTAFSGQRTAVRILADGQADTELRAGFTIPDLAASDDRA